MQAALAKTTTIEIDFERRIHSAAATGAGGAVVAGLWGAGLGFFAGGAAGAGLGLLPAFFTFGLSIPLGAAIGAGCGMTAGGAAGGSVGFVGAGAVGYRTYIWRGPNGSLITSLCMRLEAIGDNLAYTAGCLSRMAMRKAANVNTILTARIGPYVFAVRTKTAALFIAVKNKVVSVVDVARVTTVRYASDKEVQAAAATAVSGAVVLGTGGAAAGLVTGGTIGAAVGLPLAIFTFGTSIPFFAFVGGGCGAATGAAVGGTTGAAAGLSGYCAFAKRAAMGSFARRAVAKVRNSAGRLLSGLRGTQGGTRETGSE